MRLFGTSGIRGPADSLFTNQFCFDLGRTFAKFLDNHQQPGPVAVGMDPRESSPRIKEALLQGLAFSGRKLFDEGMVPVPAMNWILRVSPVLAGSVMVTGSHIKEELNGLKFFAFKEEILKEHESEITKIYQELREKIVYQKRDIKVTREDKAGRLYGEMLIKLATKPFPSWKVVVDLGNGAQSEIIPKVLKRLNLKVIVINNTPIPKKFMTRDTEAGETFKEVANLIRSKKADCGIVFDADGDRVVFVDEKGQFIPGDYTGALIAKDAPGSSVVTPINTSQVVEYIGKKVYRTCVGSPYVVEKMKEVGASFGFEANGGGISAEVMMSRDGGSTMIKILNLMKKAGKRLEQLVDELPKFYLYRTKVDCPWELDLKVLQAAKEKFKSKKIEELDGLKIWVDESTWILFRASANAPEFRVFAEAKSEKEARKLGEDGIKLVKEVIASGA